MRLLFRRYQHKNAAIWCDDAALLSENVTAKVYIWCRRSVVRRQRDRQYGTRDGNT
jgi:hypothetical protein